MLQGLAVCGACGGRMTVRYHTRQGRLVPDYLCQREGITHAGAICQRIPGAGIDRAVGALLVERMTPVTLEVALRVQVDPGNRLVADVLVLYFTLFREKRVRFFGLNCC